MHAIIWTITALYVFLWVVALFHVLRGPREPRKPQAAHRPLFPPLAPNEEREQLRRDAVKLAEEMKRWPTSTEQITRATQGKPLAPLTSAVKDAGPQRYWVTFPQWESSSKPPASKPVIKSPDKWELEHGWSSGWREPPRTVANMVVGENAYTTHEALGMKDDSPLLFISRDAPIGSYHPAWRPVAVSRSRDADYEWQVRFVLKDCLYVRYPQLTGPRGQG